MRTRAMWAVICVTFVAAMAVAQKFEVTAFIGGQTVESTSLQPFFAVSMCRTEKPAVLALVICWVIATAEFMWAYNNADTLAQPRGTGSDIRVFTLDTNQYFGNFQYHFAGREKSLRPFLLVGGGATNLSPARQGVTSATRFAFDVGGGVKYNFTRRFGLRLQAKWSPVYITTTNAGYWCDPFWGGCWAVGDNHYLNEFDATAGLTLRF